MSLIGRGWERDTSLSQSESLYPRSGLKGLEWEDWGGVNGDYADFSFAYSTGKESAYQFYKTSNFKRATFHHVVTDPVTFSLTPMQNSFDGADFRGAQFQKAHLVDFKARWADFTEPVWEPNTIDKQKLLLPSYMYNEHPEWKAYKKPPVDFTDAEMWKVNLQGSDFTGARFVNVKTHNQRETVPVAKPLEEKVNIQNNEIPIALNPWINYYTEAVPPVNLRDSNLKNTVWNKTLVNRKKYNSEALEPSFDFTGAFVDGADFKNAVLQIPGTNAELRIEEAVERTEDKIVKHALKRVFSGMHYEKNLPLFHSDLKINSDYVNEHLKLKQKEMKKDD